MQIDSTSIILISVLVIGVSLAVSYEIIKHASYVKKIFKESMKQTKLLSEIAKKNGISDEIISIIIDDKNNNQG